MYKSAMDDSVTYYSNDVQTNFVKTARVGQGIFDGNYFDRVDTANISGASRFKVSLPVPYLTSKHGGRTGYNKKRR